MKSLRRLQKNESGVTLIELLIVLGITAIFSAMVLPTLSHIETRKLNQTAIAIQNDLRYAQRMALTTGTPFKVRFSRMPQGYYVSYRDQNGRNKIVKTVAMPEGITIDDVNTNPPYTIVYTANGTTGDACTIELSSAHHYLDMTVNVGSGRVKILEMHDK